MYIPDRELNDPIFYHKDYLFECFECGQESDSEFCSNDCFEASMR